MTLLINFQTCNQPKHLFSAPFVSGSSCCVIHADWLPWNHDNRPQPSSFYTQCHVFVRHEHNGGGVHLCARVCVCALTICWAWEGGGLSYPSAYLHQNDWLCCQQWSWPRFERQPHAVWLKATRPCKYYWCTFICGPHCVWKEPFEAAVWLTKQVQGLSPVAAATERQYSLQFSTIICI